MSTAVEILPDALEPTKRARGRPRKTAGARDDGNRRAALLAAAAQLFRKQGFAATSTRDIANAAGMQSGSPFYHFKSKDALLFAVMEEGVHKALACQRSAVAQPDFLSMAPATQLQTLVRTHMEVLLGPGNDFVPVMLYEWRSLKRPQQKALAVLIADYEGLWIPVLQALYASGELRAPVPLARLFILGALNWSVQWFNPKKGANLQELTQASVALFIHAEGK